MKKLFVGLYILFNFCVQGMDEVGRQDKDSFATMNVGTQPEEKSNAMSKLSVVIKEWEDNMDAAVATAFTSMTDKEKATLAFMVIKNQYDVSGQYTKYFWKPVSIISDMMKNLAVLGTVVIPASSMLFNGKNTISQILSCACGVATLIFSGINGYSERKVTETMRLQLCLAAISKANTATEGC